MIWCTVQRMNKNVSNCNDIGKLQSGSLLSVCYKYVNSWGSGVWVRMVKSNLVVCVTEIKECLFHTNGHTSC